MICVGVFGFCLVWSLCFLGGLGSVFWWLVCSCLCVFVYVYGWWGVGILVFLEGSCEFGYFVF